MENNKDKKSGKIRPFPVINKTAQEESEDDIIRDILKKEADTYEKKLNSDKSLDNIKGTSHIFEDMVQELKVTGKWQKGKDKGDSRYQEEDWLGRNNDKTRIKINNDTSVRKSKEALEEAIEEGKREGLTESEVYSLLSESDRIALNIGKKRMAHKKRHVIFKALRSAVVVGVCIFGVSMSSQANREYVMSLWNTLVGGEWYGDRSVMSKDYGGLPTNPTQEELACAEIENALGIKGVKFLDRPEGMKFFTHTVNPMAESALMQYTYKDYIVNVCLFKVIKDKNRSRGMVMEGKITGQFETQVLGRDTVVNEIAINDSETEYFTEIDYKDGYYVISGIMSKVNFTKLLNNISF